MPGPPHCSSRVAAPHLQSPAAGGAPTSRPPRAQPGPALPQPRPPTPTSRACCFAAQTAAPPRAYVLSSRGAVPGRRPRQQALRQLAAPRALARPRPRCLVRAPAASRARRAVSWLVPGHSQRGAAVSEPQAHIRPHRAFRVQRADRHIASASHSAYLVYDVGKACSAQRRPGQHQVRALSPHATRQKSSAATVRNNGQLQSVWGIPFVASNTFLL